MLISYFAVDMVLVILLVLPTTGLTATILLPSAELTTISLWTLEAGLTSLWPTAVTGSPQLTLGTSLTFAVAGAAVGMVVYHTLNSRLSSVTEEAMSESGGGLQTMAERLLQLEGRRSFEEVLKSVLLLLLLLAFWQFC